MEWNALPIYHAGVYSRMLLKDSVVPHVDFAKICLTYNRDSIENRTSGTRLRFAHRLHDSIAGCVTTASPLMRGTKITARMGLGTVTAMGGLTGTLYNWLQNSHSAWAIPGTAAIGIGGYFGIIKGGSALSQGQKLDTLIDQCAEHEITAESHFLCESLEFGAARRAVAGAEIIAGSSWDNIPLALTIAEESLYGLANIPPHSQRSVARQIGKIIDHVDIHDPHHDIVQSMHAKVLALSGLSD